MRNFTLPLFLLILFSGFQQQFTAAYAQSILNPADTLVTYDSTKPPVKPPNGQIGKWVRTPGRVKWNTSVYKAYIYNGVAFRIRFPKSYVPGVDDGKKYPMLVFFHGLGEARKVTDNEDQLYWGAEMFSKANDNGTYDGYALFLQSQGHWGVGHYNIIRDLIDYMVTNNKLDPFRVTVNGLSSGGQGTWEMLLNHPTYIAGAIPMDAVSIWYRDTATVEKVKFTPVWNAHGALDGSPAPYTAEQVRNTMFAAGGNYRNTMYPGVAHFSWPRLWGEGDFWPFMNRAHAANPWALGGKTEFCTTDPINVTLGLTRGFTAYEWRKDGVVIPGAVGNTLLVTTPGVYDARVQRGSLWSDWSRVPVSIKTVACNSAALASSLRIEGESFASAGGIKTEPTGDVGGGMNVTDQNAKDWLNYTVNPATSGTFTVNFRVAGVNSNGQFQLRRADSSVITTVNVPFTGSPQIYRTISVRVPLTAGKQTLQIYTTVTGWNLNWWEIAHASGQPAELPLKIEAEHYTNMFGVRVETTKDTLGGQNLGYQETGDWMDYSVNLPVAGTYKLNFRVSTTNVGVQLQLRDTLGNPYGTLTVPSTGGWQTWKTFSAPVTLPAGQQIIRLYTLDGRTSGWNFNWWEITNETLTPNQLPQANAGADKSVTQPVNSVSLAGTGSDPDGTIAAYSWSVVSGPSGATFSNPGAANTNLNGLAPGTYVVRLTVTDNNGAPASDDVVVTVTAAAVPSTVPVRIQAENWTAMFGVKTETTRDVEGGGLNVGWNETNDWIDYTVNMPEASTYTLHFRAATPNVGVRLQLRNSEGTVLSTFTLASTGAWQTYKYTAVDVALPAGQQTLRLYTLDGKGSGWNFNWFEITYSSSINTASVNTSVTEVMSGTEPAFEVYPNPANGRYQIAINNGYTGNARVLVVDAAGHTVQSFTLNKPARGAFTTSASTASLKEGVYFIRVQMNDWQATKRILVKK